jgi:hypothetical protein
MHFATISRITNLALDLDAAAFTIDFWLARGGNHKPGTIIDITKQKESDATSN